MNTLMCDMTVATISVVTVLHLWLQAGGQGQVQDKAMAKVSQMKRNNDR